MKLETIFELWGEDSRVDPRDIGGEALKVSELHNKYFKILSNERLVLRKYEAELKELRLEKREFYLMGPTPEQHAKGWKLPPSGKVLRADLDQYVDSDPDVVAVTLKIAMQKEKLELLTDIIKTIHNRNWNLRVHLDWEKFKNGIS